MFRSRTALKMNRRGKKNEWEIKGLHTVMLRTVKAIRTEREMNVQPFCMIRLIFRVTNKTNKAARWHIESEMVKAFVSFDQGVCALTRQRGDSELFWYFNDEAVPFDPRNISQNGGAPPRCIPAFSGIYVINTAITKIRISQFHALLEIRARQNSFRFSYVTRATMQPASWQ